MQRSDLISVNADFGLLQASGSNAGLEARAYEVSSLIPHAHLDY